MDDILNRVSVVVTIAGILGAVYAIIVNSSKLKLWTIRRHKRAEKLDQLIESTEIIMDGKETLEDLEAAVSKTNTKIEKTSKQVENLTNSVNITIKHNERQDEEISRSLKERKIFTDTMFAILDGLMQLGANGDVTKRYKELQCAINEHAHEEKKTGE